MREHATMGDWVDQLERAEARATALEAENARLREALQTVKVRMQSVLNRGGNAEITQPLESAKDVIHAALTPQP